MKKIMFNDKFSLTQAVLGGTKTQTRRMETFQPSARMFDEIDNIESGLDDMKRSSPIFIFEVIGNIHDNRELLKGGSNEA